MFAQFRGVFAAAELLCSAFARFGRSPLAVDASVVSFARFLGAEFYQMVLRHMGSRVAHQRRGGKIAQQAVGIYVV